MYNKNIDNLNMLKNKLEKKSKELILSSSKLQKLELECQSEIKRLKEKNEELKKDKYEVEKYNKVQIDNLQTYISEFNQNFGVEKNNYNKKILLYKEQNRRLEEE